LDRKQFMAGKALLFPFHKQGLVALPQSAGLLQVSRALFTVTHPMCVVLAQSRLQNQAA
jgi:hypothetical protein